MTILEQFKVLVSAQGGSLEDHHLAKVLFLRAETEFKALCNREDIPGNAEPLLAEMMLVHYNRIGAEGEISRKEGDIQYQLESPAAAALLSKLRRFNRGRVI